MRRAVRFEPTDQAISTPVTKLGGQPVWLRTPQWPLSTSRNEPMSFIGQFRLDSDSDGGARIAYVFMTDSDEPVEGTWEPDLDPSEGSDPSVDLSS